jgi:hypothetical protein
VVEDRNLGLRSEGPFSRREEGWELGEEKEKESKKTKAKRKGKEKVLMLGQLLPVPNK